MAFHRKDEARIAADAPLSTALLQDLDDSARAAWAGRLRRACWTFDARNRPRWVGLEEVAVPLLWALSYGAKTLDVRVRGVCGGDDVTLRLYLRRADDLDRAYTETPIDEATISASGSQQTVTLSLAESDLARFAWEEDDSARDLLLVVTLQSDEGTPAAGQTVNAFNRWGVDLAALVALSNSVPAASVYFERVQTVGGASVDPPDGFPPKAQVLRQQASDDYQWLYPPVGNTYVSAGAIAYTDTARIAALGYLLVDCIEVEETAAHDLPVRGWTLNAGQYPAAQAVRRTYALARKVFAKRTAVHRLGPAVSCQDSLQQDTSAPALGSNAASPATAVWYNGSVTLGYAAINPWRSELKIVAGTSDYDANDPASAGNFVGLAWAPAPSARTFEDVDAGASKVRTAIRSLALVSVSTYSEGGTYNVRLRQTRDTATPTEGEIVAVECPAARHVNDDPHADLAGYLLHWVAQPDDGSQAAQRLHSLRGTIPLGLLHRAGLRLLRLRDVFDSNGDAAVITIEGQISDQPLDGGRLTAFATDRLLHLHALLVVEAEGDVATALGV